MDGPLCIAVIGDIVSSRALTGGRRRELQARFAETMQDLNARFQDQVLARFVITTGDEFQGLLRGGSDLPDILWEVETRLAPVQIRFGIGRGTLDTPLTPDAIAMDGPVWHRARAALETAHRHERLGGRFRGFGVPTDDVLDGLAVLLHHQRSGWTDRQREVVTHLRRGETHERISQRLDVSRQAVTKHAKAAGWDAYEEGETALRALLARFDPDPNTADGGS